jgi:hypothetical protein
LPIEENHQRGLHMRLLKTQYFRPWRGLFDLCSGLTFSGGIAGKTPRLIASYNLLKEVTITVCCGKLQFSDLSALKSKSVEQNANKSSVFANLQLQSFSLCPCQCSPRLLAFLAKVATIEKSSRHCCHCDTLQASHSWGRLQCLLIHHEIHRKTFERDSVWSP